MKFILLVLLALGSSSHLLDFHRGYVSKFSTKPQELSLGATATCPTYVCQTLPDSQCVLFNQNTGVYSLQDCDANQFCPTALDSQANATCLPSEPSSTTNGLPGDTCTVASDCSGEPHNCTNGYCYGYSVGQSCFDQPDCDVGLMCENLFQNATCQPQIETGSSCNSWIYDQNCVNGEVCNDGFCVPMFSLPVGAIVTSDYASSACSTGFFESFPDFPDYPRKGMCVEAPTSPVGELPAECSPGSRCYSADGQWSTPCVCGINPTGTAYCPVFPGDDLYQNFLNLVKQYIETGYPSSCHELNFLQEPCGASASLFASLNQAKVAVDMYAFVQNNTECIKNIFTSAYWDISSELIFE